MIIIEGPDGAGKSTLIQTLQRELGFPLAERVVDKDTKAMVDLVAWTEENVQQGFQEVLYDRHRLISEPIYGPIMRTTQQDGFSDLMWLTEQNYQFYQAMPILIFCLPPLEAVKANVTGDPDNTAIVDHIEGIYASYVAYISPLILTNVLPVILWDYTHSHEQEVVDIIREMLETRKAQNKNGQ